MKKLVQSLALTIALGASARAQNPRGEQLLYPPDSIDLLTREFLLQQAAGSNEVAFAEAQRRDASFREHQFIERVHQFVAKWNRFANEYNRKGGFNIKSVREMSKAFHDLENTDGWPKRDTKHDAAIQLVEPTGLTR